jgi:hypothetical protein
MGRVIGEPISLGTTVAETPTCAAESTRLFEQRGVNRCRACGMLTRCVTLADASSKCRLRDTDGLIDELNAA